MKIRYTYKVTVTTDEESGADNEKALNEAASKLDSQADVCETNAEEVTDEPESEPEGEAEPESEGHGEDLPPPPSES